MVDNLRNSSCIRKPRRERLQSLPIKNDFFLPNNKPLDFVRAHRNSDVTYPVLLGSSILREVSSEPSSDTMLTKNEVGVKSYYEWKPRRHSGPQTLAGRATGTLHESNLLGEMNVERMFVLSPSEFKETCYKRTALYCNPLKSELVVRVLYMLTCVGDETNDPLPSIQDQFLSDEQIRENLLKQLRDGVSRLHQDHGEHNTSGSKSGAVTPVEFICNKIPSLIRRNSQASLKAEELRHVASAASIDSHCSEVSQDSDVTAVPQLSYNNRRKVVGKLSAREKNLFAPLTF